MTSAFDEPGPALIAHDVPDQLDQRAIRLGYAFFLGYPGRNVPVDAVARPAHRLSSDGQASVCPVSATSVTDNHFESCRSDSSSS